MESTEAPPPPTAPPRDAPSQIERLLARAVPLAEAVARRKGASAAAAGEIAQNVLIDIWQEWRANPEAFDMDRPLATLVVPRVGRMIIDGKRASARRVERDGTFLALQEGTVPGGMDPEAAAVAHVFWQFVGRVLADVPEASREVFLLVYRDHATYDEVAQARGIAPATARVHCHNVLRSLRAALGHNRTLLT